MRTPSMVFGLLFAALGVLRAPAQYIPLLNQTQWYCNEVTPGNSTFDWYELGRDTVIRGLSYREGLRNGLPLRVWVREDVPAQQVWVAAAWDGFADRLLCDFNLAVGDTVDLAFEAVGSRRYVVDLIDQVNTTMGFQDRWNLRGLDAGEPAEVQWAVGVGSLAHPFYLDAPVDADTVYRLSCNYMNGMKLYDDGFGSCPGIPPPLGADDESARGGPRLGQDGERLWIQVPPGAGWKMQALDLQGRVLMTEELRTGRYEWPVETLPKKQLLIVLLSGEQKRSRLVVF